MNSFVISVFGYDILSKSSSAFVWEISEKSQESKNVCSAVGDTHHN